MIEINGMAHVILSVSEWDRCRPFYEALLSFLGLKQVFSGADSIYYVGGRTALGVGRCDAKFEGERFVQGAVGLHHLCFRARSRDDIDKLYVFLREQQAKIVHAPEEGRGRLDITRSFRGSGRDAPRGQFRPRQGRSRGGRRVQSGGRLPLARAEGAGAPLCHAGGGV